MNNKALRSTTTTSRCGTGGPTTRPVGLATPIPSPDSRTWTSTAWSLQSTYCEVSAFRYLLPAQGRVEGGDPGVQHGTHRVRSADPKRLIVNYQIPIHDIDAAVAEVRAPPPRDASRSSCRCSPPSSGLPDYWDSRYDPLWAASRTWTCRSALHIGLNTQLEDLARRDPTPQKGIFVPMVAAQSTAEALGMWVLTGILERFPQPQGRLRRTGHRLGAWWLYIVDDMATRQGYEFPGIKERCRATTSTATCSSPSSTSPTSLRHGPRPLGVQNIMWSSDYPHPVSSWPQSQTIAQEQLADATEEERELILWGNSKRVWNL